MTTTQRTCAGVRVSHVTWTPDGRIAPTLSDVCLDIPAGARVAVLGASGSGKSTLLRALAGVLAESGTGRMSGEIHVPPAGLVLQEPRDAVVAETVGRDVAFGPENLGLPRSEIWHRVRGGLAAVDFPYGTGRRTLALSGGQLQRLALAGALADAPSLLLLDEPTSMLDPPSAAEIRSTVEDVVTRTGCTLFVVEHRMADWLDLLDYAVLLGPGGVVRAAGGLHGVLRTHRDHILASGTWLPGAAPPVPVAVPE
ncbi:MAG: ABC transporter ATP-binding protein, partial [Micrococcales bacterium]